MNSAQLKVNDVIWIDINVPFGPVWDEQGKTVTSFHSMGLNLPGTLLELENGQMYLIGHINERGSAEGTEYPLFDYRLIVTRYAQLIYLEKEVDNTKQVKGTI